MKFDVSHSETPAKKLTTEGSAVGSEIELDDQLQSFRISPKSLKLKQQDTTPDKIISGGGQIFPGDKNRLKNPAMI